MKKAGREYTSLKNLARLEVERLPWPELLDDQIGELIVENERLTRSRRRWRAAALFSLAAFCALALWGLLT